MKISKIVNKANIIIFLSVACAVSVAYWGVSWFFSGAGDDDTSLTLSDIDVGVQIPEGVISSFNLDNYKWAVEQFPSDAQVAEITDANNAVKMAKQLWVKEFGKDAMDYYINRPVSVGYDKANQCWLIQGTISGDVFGGIPYILIKETGKVLAIWCTQ